MRILIIGGMHGNEPLGVDLVKLLKRASPNSIDYILANPKATKLKQRFYQTDLNRSFGKLTPESYEEIRAVEILDLTRSYDLVLDFHNTQTNNNDSLFVGDNFNRFNYLNLIPIANCVVATYDCINKYANNTISIEISLNSRFNDVEYWFKFINDLVSNYQSYNQYQKKFWRFERRVTWDEFNKFSFKIQPFEKLSNEYKTDLKLTEQYNFSAIFIGSRFTEYWATIVREISLESVKIKSKER
jgi:hypothetical protein